MIIGKQKYLEENDIAVDNELEAIATSHEEKGRTVAMIGINGMSSKFSYKNVCNCIAMPSLPIKLLTFTVRFSTNVQGFYSAYYIL